jgi:hypothetical protein
MDGPEKSGAGAARAMTIAGLRHEILRHARYLGARR